MIYITDVHMVGGQGHEHIGSVKWQNLQTRETGQNQRQEIVDWLKTPGNEACVKVGYSEVSVGVVNAKPPYLRTHKDGTPTDNLLSLPRY